MTSKGFYFLTADEGEHKETKGLLTFLFTADNKRQLISVLLKVWGSDQYAYKLKNKHVMFICEDDAVLLSSNDGKKIEITEIQELSSLQEETNGTGGGDSLLQICKNIGCKIYQGPESWYGSLLHHTCNHLLRPKFYMKLAKETKERLIDMTE